jgi:hypothetical protein
MKPNVFLSANVIGIVPRKDEINSPEHSHTMIVFVSSSRLSPYIDYYHQTVLKAL